jgi:Kef-type K+ transport system membrane component KefB
MDLFYVLLVLLVATRAFGEVAERLGQPSLVGELIAGIALGTLVTQFPAQMNGLNGLSHNEVFVTVTELGMFFLMLYAGLEMQPHKVLQHSTGAVAVALGGMLVPLALGFGLGWLFIPESELRVAQCLFLGTSLAITAVPASVRILTDLGMLNSTLGQTIVSAAVFDDVFSLVLLTWLTGIIGASEMPGVGNLLMLLGNISLFFGITTVIGIFVFPWVGHFLTRFREHDIEMSALLIGALGFAVLAEMLGLHFIVGAFMAGLYFGKRTINLESYERVERSLSSMTFGFLAPIFFASIGFQLDFAPVTDTPIFLTALILCAFLGKILGAGAGARATGFGARDAAAIGVGMSPRGAVELVIAGIALQAGLFNVGGGVVDYLFSSVILMAVVTTVVSPIVLARAFERRLMQQPEVPVTS